MHKPKGEDHIYDMHLYKLFWIFFLGCIAGVVYETLLTLLTTHTLQSRTGLIYGPFNPVYGMGAVLMTLISSEIYKKSNWLIFFVCLFVGGAFEYYSSYILEALFGMHSWEYSHIPLNIGGRTNVLYACFWGLLGLYWVRILYPFLYKYIQKIPRHFGNWLAIFLMIFLCLDITISGLALYRQNQRNHNVPAVSQLDNFLDEHYNDSFLKKIYPNMTPAYAPKQVRA